MAFSGAHVSAFLLVSSIPGRVWIRINTLCYYFAAKLVAVGYGIRKLQISCVVEDDKVSTDDLEEKIVAFEDYVRMLKFGVINILAQSTIVFFLVTDPEHGYCSFQQSLVSKTSSTQFRLLIVTVTFPLKYLKSLFAKTDKRF